MSRERGIQRKPQVRERSARQRNGDLIFLVVHIHVFMLDQYFFFLDFQQVPLFQGWQRHVPPVVGFDGSTGSTTIGENINNI